MSTLVATLPSPSCPHTSGLLGFGFWRLLAALGPSGDFCALRSRPLPTFAVWVSSAGRVLRAMVGGSHDLKVLDSVVCSVSIDVVNVFSAVEHTANVVRHHDPMLMGILAECHGVAWHKNAHVTISIDKSAPKPLGVVCATLSCRNLLSGFGGWFRSAFGDLSHPLLGLFRVLKSHDIPLWFGLSNVGLAEVKFNGASA